MADETSEPPKRKRGRPRLDPGAADGAAPSTDRSVGREALIDMTCELLAKASPGEISRASLARHAGVDPGLIRYYFHNRQSLLRTAAQALTEGLQARGAAASERTDLSPAERITERIAALLNFKLANPFYHRLMIEEMGGSEDKESRAVFEEVARTAIARYRGYLDGGLADGSLRQVDPTFLYMAIVGMCDFFVIASPLLSGLIGDDDPDSLQERYLAFVGDLLLNGIST